VVVDDVDVGAAESIAATAAAGPVAPRLGRAAPTGCGAYRGGGTSRPGCPG